MSGNGPHHHEHYTRPGSSILSGRLRHVGFLWLMCLRDLQRFHSESRAFVAHPPILAELSWLGRRLGCRVGHPTGDTRLRVESMFTLTGAFRRCAVLSRVCWCNRVPTRYRSWRSWRRQQVGRRLAVSHRGQTVTPTLRR